jgi:hypothetical protein
MDLKTIIIIISDSTLILSIAIILVGAIGALCQNIWLGKLGTIKFKSHSRKKRTILPSIMLFFPLPFTTYTYIFFRSISSKNPHINLKKMSILRKRILSYHYKHKKNS